MEEMSLLEALRNKYKDDLMTDVCKRYLSTNKCGNIDIDADFLIPDVLILNDCKISNIENSNEVYCFCGNVKELDLAQNFIKEWNSIANIFTHIPRLEFLNISYNPLHASINPSFNIPKHRLKKLALNNTFASWAIINNLLNFLPELNVLFLSLNNYTNIELTIEHCGLHELYFNDNPIQKWLEVYKLGHAFPNLKSLIMTDLKTIEIIDTCDDIQHSFQNLVSLNINKINLKSWEEIDKLNLLPQLTELRIQGLQLFANYNDKIRRQLIIAHLPKIRILNGSSVTEIERQDAERAFIRFYMDSQIKPSRYYELEFHHGKLDPLAEVDLTPIEKFSVLVCYEDFQEIRIINVTQTVMQLKHSLRSFCGLTTDKMRLFYIDEGGRGMSGAEEMKFNNRKLYNFKIKDGDKIIVEKR